MYFFIDISKHHVKKVWYTYEMKGLREKINHMTKREVETNIKELFLESNVNAEVHTASNDNIIFVRIREKQKQKNSIRHILILFALILGQDYFFCSRKNVTSVYTNVISNTMGYNESKNVQLFGRSLPSLIKLMWQRRQDAINTVTNVPYEDSKPLIT